DTISVLARSHELVTYARLGPVKRQAIEKAYWGGPPFGAFEYWAHAACVVPMEDWPFYGFRREAARLRGRRWHHLEDAERVCRLVLERLRADGPLTANGLGGAKRGGPWWDWSETKIAVEWLLDIGEVVCAQRRGFQRVYDLPERAVPAELLSAEVPPEGQLRHLLTRAASALGVATVRDFASYCGIKTAAVAELVGDLDLVPLAVEGWRPPAWALRAALESGTAGLRSRPTLLSPFDSLIWDRDRAERLFRFRHRLEAYTPKPKRVHGYFSMPLLVGDSLVGRVDPGRDGTTLVAKGVHLEPGASADAVRGLAVALRTAASWVGSEDARVEWVTPDDRRDQVLEAVRAAWS
ncbi:MAG TPA: crosslink repair DNA glycosylase YcaQ family protein, partial [Acidimicrobiales bacterium]|nr:crosslink repair DNA glycosylase YcaQ family protein [Acidimicrobiales bacterium]